MEQKVSTVLNPMQVDPRVYIRDTYATLFHKGAALAYMAMQDYEYNFRTYGRIEIIEFTVFGILEIPNFHTKDIEEKRYSDWLKTLK